MHICKVIIRLHGESAFFLRKKNLSMLPQVEPQTLLSLVYHLQHLQFHSFAFPFFCRFKYQFLVFLYCMAWLVFFHCFFSKLFIFLNVKLIKIMLLLLHIWNINDQWYFQYRKFIISWNNLTIFYKLWIWIMSNERICSCNVCWFILRE